jgi:hypothetical protein
MTNPPVQYASASTAPPRGKSIASLVLGIVSIACGFVLIAPLIGLVLGIMGLRSEPTAKGFSVTGIVLNVLAMVTWIIIAIVLIGAFGWLAANGNGRGF